MSRPSLSCSPMERCTAYSRAAWPLLQRRPAILAPRPRALVAAAGARSSSSSAAPPPSAASLPRLAPRRAPKQQPHPRDVAAASSSAAAAAAEPPPPGGVVGQFVADVATSLVAYVRRFSGLWRTFTPMLTLFFLLSFVNTILDSLKDTLVITAHGGGAAVIPYLTVYAVLPLSLIFLLAFSAGARRLSRAVLFNAIIVLFLAFFALFALYLYPNAATLHPHAFADALEAALPAGLAGGVGMVRNWTFTLFFCVAELWGDVCMGLLFWGLANETTRLADAPTLYPLFGLGANLAQAVAGMTLKATTNAGRASAAAAGGGAAGAAVAASDFAAQIRMSMAVVAALAVAALMVHGHIARRPAPKGSNSRPRTHGHGNAGESVANLASAASLASASLDGGAAAAEAADADAAEKSSSSGNLGIVDTFKVLAASIEIRCLAVMSLAQGLCTSLMEFAWKSHMRLLYPDPADFTAFLGDVATWTGVTTAFLMLASPLMFERLRWAGVANATPTLLLWGGCAFFAGCIGYQHAHGAAAAAASAAGAAAPAPLLLASIVVYGALLYVFSKGAKFSLFKPAEEMVYITLDEAGRTSGKAAIDVVGAQAGKSGGSMLQQALLLMSAGSLVGILPVMFGVFFLMLQGWSRSVHELAAYRDYSEAHSVATSMEEEDDDEHGAPSQTTAAEAAKRASAVISAAAAAAAELRGRDGGGAEEPPAAPAAA